eukprot:134192_1
MAAVEKKVDMEINSAEQLQLIRAKSEAGEDVSEDEIVSHLKSRSLQLLYGALVYIAMPIIWILFSDKVSFYGLIALLWGITQFQFGLFILVIIINATKLHRIISIQKKLDGFGNYMWYTTKIKSMNHVPMQSICGMSSTRGSSMDRVFAISLLLSLGFGISGCFSKLIEYRTIYDSFNARICSVIIMCVAQYLYLCIYFIQTRESGRMGDKLHKYFSWILTPLTPLTFLLHQHGSALSICLFVVCFMIGIMNKVTFWMAKRSGFDNRNVNNTQQSVNKWSKIYIAVELILFTGCGVCSVLFFYCLEGDVIL